MRRSSAFQGSRQSIMTPSHGGRLLAPGKTTFDDPRPIKSQAFKEQAGATITQFFQRHPRAPQITEKSMVSPAQIDFQNQFKFLIMVVLDDDYVFGKGGRKFEEECIQLLKDLEYPALSGLSRTAITAPGSPTNWSSLIAMLLWLVELAEVRLSHLLPFLASPLHSSLTDPPLYSCLTLAMLDRRARTGCRVRCIPTTTSSRPNRSLSTHRRCTNCICGTTSRTPTPSGTRARRSVRRRTPSWKTTFVRSPFAVSSTFLTDAASQQQLTLLGDLDAERKFQSFDEEMEANERLIEQCQREWAELTSKPVSPHIPPLPRTLSAVGLTSVSRLPVVEQDPLLLLNEEYGKFESDRKKFISLIDHQSQKRTKILQQTALLTDNITQIRSSSLTSNDCRPVLSTEWFTDVLYACASHLLPSTEAAQTSLQAELSSVQAAVQAQGLSVEEVTRLNTDHETLKNAFEETRQKAAEARQDLWAREMAVSRRGDQLETLVGEYNQFVYRLGLHPSPPPEVADVHFLLLFEASGTTEQEMLTGDVKGTIAPALGRLLSRRRLEITDVEGTIIKADHDLDELTQRVEALKEEIDIRAGRVKSTSDQAESQRNVSLSLLPPFSPTRLPSAGKPKRR